MPQIILGPQEHAPQIDGSVRGKAYSFLAKLAENDTLPGLHIEPIVNAVDSRVRTGRVDEYWRAVLFKVQGHEQVLVDPADGRQQPHGDERHEERHQRRVPRPAHRDAPRHRRGMTHDA